MESKYQVIRLFVNRGFCAQRINSHILEKPTDLSQKAYRKWSLGDGNAIDATHLGNFKYKWEKC